MAHRDGVRHLRRDRRSSDGRGDRPASIRIVLAKLGLDGHDRGIKVVARMLRDAGMEVIYLGLRQTTDSIVAAVEQEDADAIGLSMHNAGHLTLGSRAWSTRSHAADLDIPVIIGGIVPDDGRAPAARRRRRRGARPGRFGRRGGRDRTGCGAVDLHRLIYPPAARREGGTMVEWNFADIFETVADHVPDREAQVQGERRLTWGDTDRRADGVARTLLDGGAEPPGQGGAVPLQRPRVPRVAASPPARPGSSRSTPTTATSTTSWSTCGTTPTPSRSSSTARSPSTIEPHPRPAARRRGRGCGSTTARGPAPTGPRRTRTAAESARPTVSTSLGPLGRRPAACSTPAARPACPRA